MNTFPTSQNWLARAALAACISITAACGGGGSGGGGTGPDISGSGKLFLRGAITGFGSIRLGQTTINTDSSTFVIDDSPGSQSDLNVGQLVTIVATRNSQGGIVANLVRFEAEVEGIVSSTTPASGRFVVAGQTIITDGLTIFDGTTMDSLASGQFVEVSGRADASGNIVAAYVELKSGAGQLTEVTGKVSQLDTDNSRFRINALLVDYSAAVFDPSNLSLENGQIVEAKGNESGSSLLASEIELEDDAQGIEDGDDAEIEGIVTAVNSSSSFHIGRFLVRHSSATRFEGGSAASIAENVLLEAEGRFDASGALIASEIEFESADERNLEIRMTAPVEAVNRAAGTITALGISVSTDQNTAFRDERDDDAGFGMATVMVGDYLEIRCAEIGGVLRAGRVEREESDSEVELRAHLQSIDESTDLIVIRGVTADISNAAFERNDMPVSKAEFYAQASNGDLVSAKGTYDGTLITAIEVELED